MFSGRALVCELKIDWRGVKNAPVIEHLEEKAEVVRSY